MPSSKEKLPDTLKRSPEKVKRTYKKTLNSAHDEYNSEARAHKVALSSVKNVAKKKDDYWELKK